jgi:hypothetical protein
MLKAQPQVLSVVSVVIPAYNCAQYLERAVVSAFGFTTAAVEVLVVDDGSTDDSASVLAALQQRFPALRVLRKPNGGLSSARNHGIAHAGGAWVVLLDADDELLPIGPWPEAAQACDALRLSVQEVRQDGSELMHAAGDFAPCTGVEYLSGQFAAHTFYTPSWAYAWRSQFLAERGLQFQHGLIHEDMLFTVLALLQARGVVPVGAPAYRYFRREGSITTSLSVERLSARVRSLRFTVARLTERANQVPDADVAWWVLHSIDYAQELAELTQHRGPRWQVLCMTAGFLLRYRLWGRYRTWAQTRYRLRETLTCWLLNSRRSEISST